MRDYRPLGRRLRELLSGPYVQSWYGLGGTSDRNPDPVAIAEMLRGCADESVLPLDLENVGSGALVARVRRLLDGENAHQRLVLAVVRCAGLNDADAQEIIALHRNAVKRVELVPDGPPGRSGAPKWRTLTLSERHYVGRDRLPQRHETRQTIEVIEELDRYPYRFDTEAASVIVTEGGVPGATYEAQPDLWTVDIVFPDRLPALAQTHLEYETRFAYKAAPPPRFRRVMLRGGIDAADLSVQFDAKALPASVYWADWDSLDAPVPIRRTPLTLAAGRVFKNVPIEPGKISGFCWDW